MDELKGLVMGKLGVDEAMADKVVGFITENWGDVARIMRSEKLDDFKEDATEKLGDLKEDAAEAFGAAKDKIGGLFKKS
jgi:hypothetical protein